MSKQKMTMNTFLLITVPLIIFLLAIVIAVTVSMNIWAVALDLRFGRGEIQIVRLQGTENWDAGYYGEKLPASEVKKNAVSAAREISGEGIVLLKNNGILPLSPDAKITSFGRTAVDPIYGGSGKSQLNIKKEDVISCVKALSDTFGSSLNMSFINKLYNILDMHGGNNGKYKRGSAGRGSTVYNIGEFPSFEFSDVDYTLNDYNDAGIVVLGRSGGEGSDLSRDVTGSGEMSGKHQLELSAEEKDIIEYAKNKCESVIVILNMSTSFETGALEEDSGIDAILWMGFPGAAGFAALADILTGEVTPSGRTADIFAADFTKDPTWMNLGNFEFTNTLTFQPNAAGGGKAKYIEYEEGIYLGYRYYETAAKEFGENWYSDWKTTPDKASGTGVVYPFGFGRSYTSFSQKIIDFNAAGAAVKLSVEVENTGSKYSGKETVQIYYTAPYTKGGTEKAYVNLAAFGKTGLLAPGEKQILDFGFNKEDMASYDQKYEKAYVLDGGEYIVKLMKNSHEMWAGQQFTFNIDRTVFGKDNPRQSEKDAQSYMNADGSLESFPSAALGNKTAGYIPATNRFDYMTDYMKGSGVTNLSRTDFSATFPTQAIDKEAPEDVVKALAVNGFDYQTDAELGNNITSKIYQPQNPVVSEDNGLMLIDLRGLNYYDERWELLLNQLSYSDEELILTVGAYNQTHKLESLGKPATNELDGPQGLGGSYESDGTTEVACAWSSQPVLAATFNTELGYKMGENIGQEGLAMGLNGWYAPGLNMHRTPFSGRNFEYYSEDPLLSGKMAAKVVSGAGDCGLYTFLKHFALNDQETNRLALVGIWASEQTMREIYLKSFELCVKEAKCTIKYISDKIGTVSTSTKRASTAIMTTHNSIGSVHSTESYALLTEVTRGEWGFNGIIITDVRSGIDSDKRLRAGNDLSMDTKSGLSTKDHTSPTALHAYRKAIKNLLYAVVNSNAMTNIVPGSILYYQWSPWAVWLLVGNIIVYLFIIGLIAYLIAKVIKSKRK